MFYCVYMYTYIYVYRTLTFEKWCAVVTKLKSPRGLCRASVADVTVEAKARRQEVDSCLVFAPMSIIMSYGNNNLLYEYIHRWIRALCLLRSQK